VKGVVVKQNVAKLSMKRDVFMFVVLAGTHRLDGVTKGERREELKQNENCENQRRICICNV